MWFDMQPCAPDYTSRHAFLNVRELPASAERVFEVLIAPEPWPEWFTDIRSVEYVTAPPHSQGTERIVRLTTMSVHERFTVYEPGRHWTFYLKRSTLPLASHFLEDYVLIPLEPGRCRLQWTVYYEPRWWVRPLHPLLRPIFKKMFRDGITGLERWLQTHPESTR